MADVFRDKPDEKLPFNETKVIMKKILLDCRFWGPEHTGLGRYTQELVSALIKLKPDFELLQLTLSAASIKPYSWAEQVKLSSLINSKQPDLTHFLHFNLPLIFSGKFVVTIHDLIKHHSKGLQTTTHWPGLYWLKRFGYYFVIKKAITKSRAIMVPSRWVKQDILRFYPVDSRKIFVTPEAAGTAYFKPVRPARLPYDYFIYVGNAYPHKNVIQLIKAMKIIAKDRPNTKLVIITGRDWFYQKLRREITQLQAQGVVKLKDFTSDKDLAGLYRGAAAYVTASYFEGFGLPGLEAMAAGTLVIASNRAALPEVYGRHAIYFDPENLNELVAKMNEVLKFSPAKRRRLIESARAFCRGYSWQKTAAQTLSVYEKLLE